MSKICKNCAAYNSDYDFYCRDCGKELDPQPSKVTKIFTTLVICLFLVLAAGFLLYDESLFEGDMEFESEDFGIFTIDVPAGSDFQEFKSLDDEIYLENRGNYSLEVQMMGISETGLNEFLLEDMELLETSGDIEVYADSTGEEFYLLAKDIGEYTVILMGSDMTSMKEMLESIEVR